MSGLRNLAPTKQPSSPPTFCTTRTEPPRRPGSKEIHRFAPAVAPGLFAFAGAKLRLYHCFCCATKNLRHGRAGILLCYPATAGKHQSSVHGLHASMPKSSIKTSTDCQLQISCFQETVHPWVSLTSIPAFLQGKQHGTIRHRSMHLFLFVAPVQ